MENPSMMEPPAGGASEAAFWDDSINLRHYWHVVLERRWLVLTAFVVVIVLCLIYLFKAQPIYQAKARLQIDREQQNVLTLQDILPMAAPEQDYLQTQYKNLQNPSLITNMIRRLHLDKDPHYAKARDLERAVANAITIAPIRLSRLVDIEVEHPNGQTAADMANTLARLFLQANLAQKRTNSIIACDNLSEQATNLQAKVQRDEAAVQAYRETNRMVSLDDQENILLQALRSAQESYTSTQVLASAAVKEDQEVQRLLNSGADPDTLPQVAGDALIQGLKSQHDAREAELSSLLQRYTEKYMPVEQLEHEIDSFTRSIQGRASNIVSAIHNRAALAQAATMTLSNLVNEKTAEIYNLDKLRIGYNQLVAQDSLDKMLFTNVLAKAQEYNLAASTTGNNMEMVISAAAPLRPVKPRWVLTLFLGVVGGLGAGLGLAFFVNYLDDSIKTQDDVEVYLRLPFLGYIPNIKTNSVVERDLQSHLHPQSNAAEGFRTIRATIALMRNADKFRVLTVTSTIPSEGKSLLASNLAIVTAQTGLKTLLVDTDLRRPSVHKAFQLHSPVGLSAYLGGAMDSVEELVHATEVPNLEVVCAGGVPTSPSELVSSKRMAQFLQEARNRYDRVFLDCPPVSAVSDPLMIAAVSDGVVFVTKFNKIRRDHARRTVQRIQDAGIYILGVVLNDIDFEGKDSYYYSYYYYQNRYYSSHYKTGGAERDAKEPEADARRS
jgi:polysaccharide biosynthesis transport protein